MNQIAKDCAAELERQLDNQEKIDDALRITVMHWKKLAENSYYEFDISKKIERIMTDHIADPHEFVHMALMAQLSGKGAQFLEAQLKALALCEVDHE